MITLIIIITLISVVYQHDNYYVINCFSSGFWFKFLLLSYKHKLVSKAYEIEIDKD